MQIKIHDIVQFIAKRQHEYHAEYDREVRSEVDEAYEKRCHMAAGKWLASNELMDDLRKIHLAYLDKAYVDTLLKEE